MFWRFGTIGLVLGGIFLIYKASLIVNTAYTAMPSTLITTLTKSAVYFTPFFLDLLVTSLKYLWQPILMYLLIVVLTKSAIWRKFWCLVGVSLFFLILVSELETTTWKEYHLIPLLILPVYMFLLWLLPREFWNIAGLVIASTLGLIILILPDLPTTIDDFGMFGAILAFFLGYLNALASVIQRLFIGYKRRKAK